MKKLLLIILCLSLIVGLVYGAVTTTTNLSLVKLGSEDTTVNFFDTFNDNMELIDAAFDDPLAYSDDTITKANFADGDWGDMSVFSNTVTLDAEIPFSNIVKCSIYDHPDDAITAISSANKTLLVTEAETCDNNFTVPTNVTVKFERGGKWTINNGITVTFNGQIDAGLFEIFSYTGTGTLGGSPKNEKFYPQWWGALGNYDNDDTTAIQNTIDLVFGKGGGTVYFSEGTYNITSALVIKNTGSANLKVYLCGEGKESTVINNTNAAGAVAIQIGNSDLSQANQFWGISNLTVLGNTSSGHGIKISYAHFGTIRNVNLSQNGESGIYFDKSWSNWVENIHSWDNDNYGLIVGDEGNNISIINSEFHYNDVGGIQVEEGYSTRIIGCGIENNGTYGVLADGANDNTANLFISGNYFENNPTTADTGASIKLGGTKIAVNPTISGNFFHETASARTVYGIDLENTYTPTIIGNQFDGNGFDEKIRSGTVATNVIRINNRPDDEGKVIAPAGHFLSLEFEGSTADEFETTLTITDPTADRTITFPNSDETVGVATSGNTTTFTCTDNENEALACPIIFVDGATGSQGAETDDIDLTYNPSTGTLKVTALDLTTALPDAEVANNITIDLATLATTITVTDNENTAENNPICFVAGADPDGGSLGIETDGDLHYNPSTGLLTSTGFAGALSGNATTATTLATPRNIGGVSFDGSAAIVPTTIVVADTTDTTSFVALWESATGSLLPKSDGALLYNAGTGMAGANNIFFGNFSAAAAPVAATDDITLGYVVGSQWIDTTGDEMYICLDNTDGAAVWSKAAPGGGGGSVDTSGTPVQYDFGRFTDADTIEGRSYTETRQDLSIETAYADSFATGGAGTSGDPWTGDCIQAAINSITTGVVYLNPGYYQPTTNDDIDLKTGITLKGIKGKSIIDGSNFSADINIIEAVGSAESAIAATANITAGDVTITVGDTSSLTAGDFIRIGSTEVWAGGSYPCGEVQQIKSITDGTHFLLYNHVWDDYTTANGADVSELNLLSDIVIDGITILRGGADDTYGIFFSTVRNCLITNCEIFDATEKGISVDEMLHSVISNNYIEDSYYAGAGDYYGMCVLNASQYNIITNNTIVRARHALTFGGGSAKDGLPRFNEVTNNVFIGASESNSSLLDIHLYAEYTKFSDNIIICDSTREGISIEGFNSEIIDNTFSNCEIGVQLLTPAQYTVVRGNTMRNCTYGVYVRANSATKTCYLDISDNVMRDVTYGIFFMRYSSAATTYKEVYIKNNIIDVSTNWLKGDTSAITLDSCLIYGNEYFGKSATGIAGITNSKPFKVEVVEVDSDLSADHSYSGEVETAKVGESVVFGELLYFNWTDKEWKKTDADAAATMPGLRIALESKADGADCLMLVRGYIRDDSAFAFAGSMVYTSCTPGDITSTAPSASGDQVQRVGVAIHADKMYFNPSIDVGEI